MAILKLAASVAALTLAAGAAHAGNVLSDNFDSENGGATALQYTNFANFNVVGGVDLVGTPNPYGITCAGGGGSCVDLAGTPGPGEIVSKNFYGFGAGDVVTLSFDISGNQRTSDANNFFGEFNFAGNTKISDYTLGGGFGSAVLFPSGIVTSFVSTGTSTTGGNQPFETYTMSFTADQAGSVKIGIGTQDGGNIGPVLDNVNLSVSAVPEPASWAMMLVGFGGLGATLRASRRKPAAATA